MSTPEGPPSTLATGRRRSPASAFTDGSVLLHAAGTGQGSAPTLLFQHPILTVVATRAEELVAAFQVIEDQLAAGLYVAGYVTYEAGLALNGLQFHALPNGEPLLCFGVYRQTRTWSAQTEPVHPLPLALLPTVPVEEYDQAIATVQQWIADGDIYQANYTVPLQSECTASADTIFHALLAEQPAAFSAAISLRPTDRASPTILSFSPELFFRTTPDGMIATRPMKGTVAREQDAQADTEAAAWLANDAKNRAEHVMIVDLLRNDLGRICQVGSVGVSGLFSVKSLPTVHQMVSGVHGQLPRNTQWIDVFRALFPSGSVTGAPKRRAMQRLHQVENAPRGVYTGAIGYIGPDGTSCFSVAIRTLTLREHAGRTIVTCGVGGGVVADSTTTGEYAEALLKSAFIRRASVPVELIETMLVHDHAVRWLEPHLCRVQRSAIALGFACDPAIIRQAVLFSAASLPTGRHRLRLTLQPEGTHGITSQPLTPWPTELRVRVASRRSRLGDPALAHKTNFRSAYDDELALAKNEGYDEALFANEAGLLTEACVTNLYFIRGGQLFTPYLECGVLPGILRGRLLSEGLVTESLLSLQTISSCEGLLLGNSLRGLHGIRELRLSSGETLTWQVESLEQRILHLHRALAIQAS